jgi:hypothetical protein
MDSQEGLISTELVSKLLSQLSTVSLHGHNRSAHIILVGIQDTMKNSSVHISTDYGWKAEELPFISRQGEPDFSNLYRIQSYFGAHSAPYP